MTTLFALLGGQRGRLAMAIGLAGAAALVELVPYYLLYRAAGVVLSAAPAGAELMTLALWMAVALLVKYVLLSLGGYFSHVAAFQVLYEVRQRIAHALTRMPLLDIGRYSSGNLRKIVLSDVERLEGFIAHHTIELTAALISPLVAAVFLFWLDWKMALAALATIPLAWLVQALFSRGMGARVQAYNQATEQLNGAIVEYLRNIPVMKAFRQTSSSFGVMRERLQAYHTLVRDFTRHSVPGWSVFVVLLTANIFILLPVGLWRFSAGTLDLPTLILVLMLGSGLLKPLLRVALFSSMIREILAGVERIQPFLTTFPAAPTDSPVDVRAQDVGITVRGLCFSYGERRILENVDLELAPGSFNALVGPSGAGKSTLSHIVAGLLPATAGEVLAGDVPLSKMDDETRARTIAVVTQDAFLFRGTLADNLRLGCPGASEDELYNALNVAQARQFVDSLAEGLQTRIGERGTRLSGGERQRIAIARALLTQAPVLILDEATAFADALTEAAFYRALREYYPRTTVLVIAHRLYAVRDADRIILMDEGRISASGSHAALLSGSLVYRRLWQSQFDMQQWHIRETEVAYAGIQ